MANNTLLDLADFRDLSELERYKNIENPPIYDEVSGKIIIPDDFDQQLSQEGGQDLATEAEQIRQDRAAREALFAEIGTDELALEDLALFVRAKREFLETAEGSETKWILVRITSV